MKRSGIKSPSPSLTPISSVTTPLSPSALPSLEIAQVVRHQDFDEEGHFSTDIRKLSIFCEESENTTVVSSGCSSCQKIIRTFVRDKLPRDPDAVDLGTWDELVHRKDCKCCQKLVAQLSKSMEQQDFDGPPASTMPITMVGNERIFMVFLTQGEIFSVSKLTKQGADVDSLKQELVNPGGMDWYDHMHGLGRGILPALELIPRKVKRRRAAEYYRIHPDWIDVARIEKWQAHCDKFHGGICHELSQWQTFPAATDLILIDVRQCCLLRIANTSNCNYVALSYVWGQHQNSLELRSSNQRDLCTVGFLQRPEIESQIPKTVLDAIVVARKIGSQFLWVDRLCIVQDSPTHLTQQLQQMASIYANSCFTIIAADGSDANYGLPGITSPRRHNETTFRFDIDLSMVKRPEVESFKRKPFWHSRAWTFQERAVSPRTLIFTNNTVYWDCLSARWFENIKASPDLSASHQTLRHRQHHQGESRTENKPLLEGRWPSYSLKIQPWPDLEQYFHLVDGFNGRNLTFETDALLAFTAIISAMSKSFPGGFHYGLPVFMFDIGLLWTSSTPLKRRTGFPTWSWLGWAGRISMSLPYSNQQDPKTRSILAPYGSSEVQNLVIFYKVPRNELHQIKVDNSYHVLRDEAQNADYSPPLQWTKSWDCLHRRFVFQHEDFPAYKLDFPYPVFPPVLDDESTSFTPHLSFEAQSCTLFLRTAWASGEEADLFVTIDLGTIDDQWAGTLGQTFRRTDDFKEDTACELIAISQQSAMIPRDEWGDVVDDVPFDEMKKIREIGTMAKYEFYNVLWIEWVDGVAYRKALGRVWKDAWERQEIKTIQVTLG
ncbi:hypothetical protein FKW77_006876 [Venturia effusa]|uniref:Heterokaryon incompatibility domain-containing protein n=1 Tax=Venturia effusa TaxID=50376 RepID=A0A517LLQ6_9PEZI|nr:hypothetical protein FKW77_006876 [Venturia effusa]